MSWWDERVLPRCIDRMLSTGEVDRLRARVCEGLSGDVLEIGFGSGRNLPHYPAAVSGVWAVEPSELAWRLAQSRISAGALPVTRAGLDGARLDLPDQRYDAVVSTFTMCTIPDLAAALGEIRRVLRPGGVLTFVEHGLSPQPRVAKWQRRLQPVHGRLAGGCQLNRPIAERVRASGLDLQDLDNFYLKGPKFFGYLFLGRARTTSSRLA